MLKGIVGLLAVCLAAVVGVALAQEPDLLDLSQPEQSFWDWNLSNAIQLAIAIAAFGTMGVAFSASRAWKKQLSVQHDMNLARNMLVQLLRLENSAMKAMGVGHFSLERIEKGSFTELDEGLIATWKIDSKSWMEEVSQLRASVIEAEAIWPKMTVGAFDAIMNVVGWGADCVALYSSNFDRHLQGITARHLPAQETSSLRNKQKTLGLPFGISRQSKDILEPMVREAKEILKSKL